MQRKGIRYLIAKQRPPSCNVIVGINHVCYARFPEPSLSDRPAITPTLPSLTLLSLPLHPTPPLNLRPPRPKTSLAPMPHPKDRHRHRTNQPKQRIHQINPNRILHPLNPRIPLRVFLNIHVPEEAEERDPEDEEDQVPDEDEGDARGEGREVEECGEGGEGGGYFGVDPFPIAVLARLVRAVQINAIQSADREREDELDEAIHAVRDVRFCEFETHLAFVILCAGIFVGLRATW